MSKYIAKVGEWVTPDETTGSIQNISKSVTLEVTSSAEANTGLTLSPMQIINFDGTVYVRSAGSKEATFTAVPFKVSAGGGGGGGTPYTLPTASATIKGGIKIGSGLTMTGEVLSVDKQMGDWTTGKSYSVGDIIVKDGKLYYCKTPHTSTVFSNDIANWESLTADIASWTTGTYYDAGSVVIYNGSIYQCTSGHTAGSTFDSTKFTSIGGSGGGDAKLEESITANTAAGAIKVNDVVAKDTTFTQFVKQLLVSEIAPTTTFTASGSGLVKKGTTVSSTTLKLVLNSAGTGTFVSIDFMEGSTVIDTQTYVSGTNTYTYVYSTPFTTDTTFKAVLHYKKSDGTSATITKEAKFTFVNPAYYGAVSAPPTTEAGILAVGNETVTDKRGRTVTYTLSNQKSCYCYPVSYGALTSIKDANNFEYIGSYDRTTVTANSVPYYVYTLKDPVTITGFKQIFA